jgi:predicted DNA-binding transcriptional regulator AlpA
MRVVDKKQAAKITGLSIPTLDRRHADGTGPARVKLTKGRVGYLETDLASWIEQRREPPKTAA